MTEKNELQKLDYLDSLRGIAVLMVIFTHAGLYVNLEGMHDVTRLLVQFASRGVQLFYILSAFTLFYSLDSRALSDKSRWTDFFIRRLFRIGPLWWLMVFAFLWLRNEYTFSHTNIISNLFFVHGFHPQFINSIVVGGWSIGVEMVFYLLIPLFYKVFRNLNRTIIGLFWIYAASRLLIVILRAHNPGFSSEIWKDYLFYFLPNQMPVFFAGFILFHLVVRKDFRVSTVGYIHAIATILLAYVIAPDWFHSQNFLLLPLVWLASRAPQVKLWNNRVLQYIGKVSFSMYLVHFVAVLITRKMDIFPLIPWTELRILVGFVVVAALATAIATLTWHIIEKPGQKLGSRLIRYLDQKSEKAIP